MRGSFIALALCALILEAHCAERLERSRHRNRREKNDDRDHYHDHGDHDHYHDHGDHDHYHDHGDHDHNHDHGDHGGDNEPPAPATSCDLNIRMDFSISSPPLVLVQEDDGEWKLAAPTHRTKYSSYMDLTNKNIKLACPGEGNTLSQIGSATAEAVCSASSGLAVFAFDGQSIPVANVTCKNRITPYEQETGNSCKGDGTEFSIGFIVEGKMFDLLTSCQRVRDGKSYYSHHVLYGQHFPERGYGGDRKEERPNFSYYNKNLFRGFNPNAAYNKENEIQCLADAMGDEAYYIFNSRDYKYFARGHFCPNADFIMDTWRDATFTYVNAQPQWQQVNGGNWEQVETFVRYHAAAIDNTLNVITGATGNLAPRGYDVFLATQNRMPVPKNYVKLVHDPRTNQCIGFVGNNFDISFAPPTACSIFCEDFNWPRFKKVDSEGTISCCTAQDIMTWYSEALPDDNIFDCSGGIIQYEGGN